MDFDLETINHGVSIPIDLEGLIENIYVSPGAPTWHADLVTSVVKRYGYDFPVIHSDLDRKDMLY
jgi:hypothetical protein